MKLLKISKDISLPMDVVTQTIAILAKRRAGKSYTMRKLTEQLMTAGQQIVLVDPKGDQWGLRSSADGKSPGFPIVILGGEHGDAPLEPNAGEVVAKLVVEERVSILLDLSAFRKYEIAIFMAAFLETLYRLKAQEAYRTPVMLIIDEADAIAPQKPQKGEERMLGAAEDIVRRGGQRGIGCALITQRSAVLNKNVLTQAQMLIVLRTIAPQDLAAMKAWIDVHGSVEQGKELMDSLPSLPIGDAWFWSPGWPTDEGIFARSHVLPIETFDSGATPKPGTKPVVPKNLADVDLNALKKQMAATIEKAKNDDPKALRKTIADLRKKLDSEKPVLMDPTKEKIVEVKVITDAQITRLEKLFDRMAKEADKHRGHINLLWDDMKQPVSAMIAAVKTVSSKPSVTFSHTVTGKSKPSTIAPSVFIPVSTSNQEVFNAYSDDKTLVGGAVRMIKILVSQYPIRLTRSQLGTFAKMKPRGGSFNTYLSQLRSKGYIKQEGDLFMATQAGLDYVGEAPNPPSTAEEVIDMWMNNLSGKPRSMFNFLVENRPQRWTRDAVAQAVGMSSLGGSFNTYLSILRSNGLITTSDGLIGLADSLFI